MEEDALRDLGIDARIPLKLDRELLSEGGDWSELTLNTIQQVDFCGHRNVLYK